MEELWQEIWQTISRNKWRSLMTAFGVFWGLLMLILLLGFGASITGGLLDSIKSVPSNSIFVMGSRTTISYKGFGRDRRISVDNIDMQLVKNEMSDQIRFITPINFAGTKNANVGEFNYDASVVGTTPSYYHVLPTQMIYGRYLNEVDQRERRKVCVIGRQTYETLFPGGGDPCGQMVQVGSISYTIVGVAKKLSELVSIGTDLDRSLLLPINTEQLMYNEGSQIDLCVFTLRDKYPVGEWQEPILSIMKDHHYVHPDDKSAFFTINLADLVTAFSLLFRGLDILLWIVGCGSLLAGLIGISNIMLVTVKERTQEIGIRRALGAKPQTIVRQILAESLVLTASAGLIGLMTGIWLLRLAGKIIEANPLEDYPLGDPQISFSVALAATFVIIIGGLLAGWMPAKRAMKIKAIEALREE